MKILVFLLLISSSAFADLMNLNEFLPTRMEDASVTKLQEVQLQATGRYEDADEKVLYGPTLRWGAVKRVQLEYQPVFISGHKAAEKGSGINALGGQWQFNDQDDWVPSLAISPQFIFPTGKDTHGTDVAVKLILTYTLVGTLSDPIGQFHLNYRWTHNSDKQKDEQKVGKLLIFGYNHRIGTYDALLVDFTHEKAFLERETVNELELGWLHEIHEKIIFGLGAGLDVHEGYLSYNLSGQYTF